MKLQRTDEDRLMSRVMYRVSTWKPSVDYGEVVPYNIAEETDAFVSYKRGKVVRRERKTAEDQRWFECEYDARKFAWGMLRADIMAGEKRMGGWRALMLAHLAFLERES